jgi:hypothetical protein
MTSGEKLHWFWATGILPGSVFGDFHDRGVKLPDQPPRPINWLRLDLTWRGRRWHRTRRPSTTKKVN